MTLVLSKLVLQEMERRQAGSQAANSRRSVPVCPFVVDVTPGIVWSTVVTEGPNFLLSKGPKGI